MKSKYLSINLFLVLILLSGVIFAYFSVYTEFVDFYLNEGTLFKLKDCLTPNPVTTACFYGAFGFLIAFVWSLILFKNQATKFSAYIKLTTLLLGCTIFAWYNNYSTLYSFFFESKNSIVGCTGKIITNPFTTPCFIGASIFTLALSVCAIILFMLRHRK